MDGVGATSSGVGLPQAPRQRPSREGPRCRCITTDAGLRVDSPVTSGVDGLLVQSRAIVRKRAAVGKRRPRSRRPGVENGYNCILCP